jgi:crotonobetainyl-CoA:carnitine CoA-transferase CaiB-like acyl-CoA transferase
MNKPSGPLTGLKIIDLTQVLSGPFCTMLLADLGADVVKVEPPGGDASRLWGPHPAGSSPAGDLHGAYGGYFASVNRNKRSVCLDLKTEEGRLELLELLENADALVENFRVGVMDRLGLSYPYLHERLPRLIYASIRGFGDPLTGPSPYSDWPAFDIIAQAMGGIMGITGTDAAHPVKVGPGVGDIFPGALAALGLLAAVRHAEHTGVGQMVDVAMYDSVLALCERIVYQYSLTGADPVPQGNTHPILCPYGAVRSANGFVSIATPSDHHWRLLATAIGRQELGTDPRFATNADRLGNSALVYATVEAWTSARASGEVVQVLGGLIPCAPVNSASDILKDPHVAAREMIVRVDFPGGGAVDIVGAPIKFTETPARRFERAPLLGEHNSELLTVSDHQPHLNG